MRRTFGLSMVIVRKKKNIFVLENGGISFFVTCARLRRRDARVAEEARLESVYSPKGNRGFESPSFRFLYI